MFDLLRDHQVDLMLALASICLIIAFFTFISKIMSKRRKMILIAMEIGAAIWLEADRAAYIFKGEQGVSNYWIVRISNFFDFHI